jgi:hypothetical protein
MENNLREIFEKVKCELCIQYNKISKEHKCILYTERKCYIEYLESQNKQMLEALIELRKASKQYECKQCPNDIQDEEHCHGCVEYTDNIIEQITNKKMEE